MQIEIAISGPENFLAQGVKTSNSKQQAQAVLAASVVSKPIATSSRPESGAAAKIVRTVNDDLRSALITSALAQITLRPAGWVQAAAVAEIRADAGTGWFVLDFRSMRTINGIAYNAPPGGSTFDIAKLRVWTGTQFGDEFSPTATDSSVRFSEQFTERILVNFNSPTGLTLDLLRQNMALSLPGAPGDLRLAIGQKVVWAEPGPIRLDREGVFVQSIDITKDLTAALATAEPPLEITLSAAYPALLELEVASVFLRRHDIDLGGGSLSVIFSQPGTSLTLLDLPNQSAAWQIQALELTVEAELPEQRTLPANTPPASEEVRLNVASDHALVIRLGAEADRFSKLASVWILAEVPPTGAEVAGALYGGSTSGPDTTAPLVLIPPLTLTATTAATWFELPLTQELELATPAALWLELQATRGTPAIVPAASPGATATPPNAAPADPSADVAVMILRGAPGGPFGAFKIKLNGAPLALRGLTRLSGTPRSPNATPALIPRIAGSAASIVADESGFTPERSGTTRRIDLLSPLSGAALKGVLPLELESRVTGSYRFTGVRVLYTSSGDSAALLPSSPSGENA
jgi:hypothetical protein